MNPDITISIINTNNREVVLDCLNSVFKNAGSLCLEVIVVDNACKDNSAEAIRDRFPQVTILEHEEMMGFSTNNNLAFSKATGRYLMLLNDDTIVKPNALQTMVNYMDTHLDVAVVGANLLNPDETPQLSYGYSPNPLYEGLRPFSELLLPIPPSHESPMEVGNVCGAGMMVRASVAEKIGLLDTRFDPLYSEEVDWCFRFEKAGWRIFHLPAAEIIHIGGSTMNRTPSKRYERIYEKKALFFKKHYGKGTVAIYKITLFLSNLLKSIIWLILWGFGKRNSREEFETHWNLTRRVLSL